MGHRTVFISLAGDGTAVLSPELRSAKSQGIFYVHPSGEEVWVANGGSGDLSILAAKNGNLLAKLSIEV